MIEFVLIRHGQTESNAAHVIQGQLPGQLTEKGYAQANLVGKRLENSQWAEIHVSDLARTQQTWNEIAKYNVKSHVVVAEPLLREKAAGEFEGGSYGAQAKMAKKLGVDVRKYRPKDGGESHDDVLKRALTFIQQITDRLLIPKNTQVSQVLVVTHGGFISEFQNACKVITGRPLTSTDSANNCSIHVFQFTRNNKGMLVPKQTVNNDISHLKENQQAVKPQTIQMSAKPKLMPQPIQTDPKPKQQSKPTAIKPKPIPSTIQTGLRSIADPQQMSKATQKQAQNICELEESKE